MAKTATQSKQQGKSQPAAAEPPKKPGTAVAAPANTAVGNPLDYFSDAGKGLEEADKASFAIPFLVILQSNSPACAPKKEGGLGLAPSQFMDSVTNETFEELSLIPCAFQRRYIAWKPRSTGGGFAGEFSPAEVEAEANPLKWEMKDDEKAIPRMTMPDGAILKDTRTHYVLYKDSNGTWRQAILALSSTQIKKSKKWVSRIKSLLLDGPGGKKFNPPSYSHVYEARTVREENTIASWYGIEIGNPVLVDNAELARSAKEFYELVMAGKVKVAEPTRDVEAGGSAGEGDGEKF